MITADAFAASYDHVASRRVIEPILRLQRTGEAGTSLALWSQEIEASSGSQAPSILRPAMERLAELAELDGDWDSYGAVPPTLAALVGAVTTMQIATERLGGAGERVAPLAIMPIADGGIQLEWNGPSADLELNIGPDGGRTFLLIERDEVGRRFREGDDLSASKAIELIGHVIGA